MVEQGRAHGRQGKKRPASHPARNGIKESMLSRLALGLRDPMPAASVEPAGSQDVDFSA